MAMDCVDRGGNEARGEDGPVQCFSYLLTRFSESILIFAKFLENSRKIMQQLGQDSNVFEIDDVD